MQRKHNIVLKKKLTDPKSREPWILVGEAGKATTLSRLPA